MDMITAADYPTRYTAFKRPGVLVMAGEVEERGGFEAAVYQNLRPNAFYPHIENDGVYVEVIGLAKANGKGVRAWLVDGQASQTDRARAQKRVLRQHPDLAAALADVEGVVAELEAFVAATVTAPRPEGDARARPRADRARAERDRRPRSRRERVARGARGDEARQGDRRPGPRARA